MNIADVKINQSQRLFEWNGSSVHLIKILIETKTILIESKKCIGEKDIYRGR